MLNEPPRQIRELTAGEQMKQMRSGVQEVWNNKKILWLTGYACVIAVTSKIWFFMYNPYFELVGMKVSEFGYVFFTLNLLAWLSSHYGHALEKRIGDSGTVWMLVPTIGVPLLLMAFYPYPTMAYMVLFQNAVRGMYGPFFDSLTGKFLNDESRATVMSVQSSAVSVVASVGLWVFGFLVNSLGILSSLKVLGSIALLGYFFLMCFWTKLFKRGQ
jgi:predicted MFS family arabinose efflux permease